MISPNISQLCLEAVLWETIIMSLHESEKLYKGGHYIGLSAYGLECETFLQVLWWS